MPDINEIGLCLSDGGAKGAFQVGVFKALKEYGLVEHITAVSGTSAGALNAVLFMGKNFDNIEKLWRSFSADDFIGIGVKRWIRDLRNGDLSGVIQPEEISSFINDSVVSSVLREGILSQRVIKKLLKNNVDMCKICKSNIDCYITCRKMFSHQPITEFFLNKPNKWTPCSMRKIILASAAIPVAYPPININGEIYNDGGASFKEKKDYNEGKGNVPYNILLEKGYKNVIVVDYMQQQLEKREGVNIINITPSWKCIPVIDTLNFKKIDKWIEEGYAEARKVLIQNHDLINMIKSEHAPKKCKDTKWWKSKNISDFKEFTTVFGKCDEIIVTGKLAKGIKVLYSLDRNVIANQISIISYFVSHFDAILFTPITFMGITSLGLLPGIGLPLASALIILYRKLGNKLLDYIISYELYDTDEKDRAILYRRIIK